MARKGGKLTLAQRSLVTAYKSRRMVDYTVRAMCRLWREADPDDLRSCGNEALVHAALKFDATAGVAFTTYASKWVRGAMMRHLLGEARHTNSLIHRLAHAPGRMVHRDDAEAPPVEQQRQLHHDVRAYLAQILLETVHGAEPPSPEQAIDVRQTLTRLQRARVSLPPKFAELLRRHYEEETPLRQLAEEWGLNERTTRRQHQQALALLASAMSQIGNGGQGSGGQRNGGQGSPPRNHHPNPGHSNRRNHGDDDVTSSWSAELFL